METKRIVIDPKIMVGKPVIKGTRITVERVLKLLAKGETQEDILANYPHLTQDDIRAVLQYATDVVEEERVYPIGQLQYA